MKLLWLSLLFSLLLACTVSCSSQGSPDELALESALKQNKLPEAAELVEKLGEKSLETLMATCPQLTSSRKDGCYALLGVKGSQYRSKPVFEFLRDKVKNGSNDDAVYSAYGLNAFKDASVIPDLRALESRVVDPSLKKRVRHTVEMLERTAR